MSNNPLKSIDFVKADISTHNNLDFFIVWGQDLSTLEFTALSLFTDIDKARDYKDRLIINSYRRKLNKLRKELEENEKQAKQLNNLEN